MNTQSLPRLGLVPHYAIPVGGDEILIRTSARLVRLRGAAVRDVMTHMFPRLDGTRTEEQIVTEVSAEIEVSRVRGALKALRARELLRETPARAPSALTRYLEAAGQSAASLDRLDASRVRVACDDPRVGAALAALLVRSGFGEALPFGVEEAPAPGGTLLVAVIRGPAAFSAPLLRLNEVAITRGVPLLACAMVGAEAVQLGPHVIPGSTACIACLQSQLERAIAPLRHVPGFDGARSQDTPTSALQRQLAVALVATEAVRATLPDCFATTNDAVHTVSSGTLSTETYAVRRDSRCDACGSARNAPPMQVWS